MDPVAAIRRHGALLESARGPVPNLAEMVAGVPIRGSWWGHPASHEIFEAINQARSSSVVVATRLVDGKVTLVHRRLWPALARISDRLDSGALDALREEHTPAGRHAVTVTPYPDWVPEGILVAAVCLSAQGAVDQLPEPLQGLVRTEG